MAKVKPVDMIMHRNITVRSTSGHMITFKKGVPQPVVPFMVRECAELGAVRADEVDVFAEPEEDAVVQPTDPSHRADDILEAIERIVERNDPHDFTASGVPSVPTVTKELGYRVDRTEVARVWRQRKEDLADDAE